MNRTRALGAALFGLVLLPVFAQPARVPFELAQRLAGSQAQLYVGTVPPKARLSFRLPTPPGTRVVGSTASPQTDEAFDVVTLYLSSAQTGFDFQAYYRRVFRDLGWQRGHAYEQTGFLPSNTQEPDGSLTFCHMQGEREANVYLSLVNKPQMVLIDAQIHTLDSDQGWGACETENTYTEPPLPALSAPAESKTELSDIFSGSSPAGGNGGSLIILKTKLEASALLEHYAQQLELSGWQAAEVLVGGNVQLSTYRFKHRGELYSATLQVTSLGGTGHYLAQLSVVNL